MTSEEMIKNFIDEASMIKDFINKKSAVFIYYNNELAENKWLYSVQVKDTDFWLDSFKTEQEAYTFCKNNGLPIISIK